MKDLLLPPALYSVKQQLKVGYVCKSNTGGTVALTSQQQGPGLDCCEAVMPFCTMEFTIISFKERFRLHLILLGMHQYRNWYRVLALIPWVYTYTQFHNIGQVLINSVN